MKRSACLIGMLALILSAATAAAQETRGSIEGVVKDNSGAVLPGVTVEARSTALVGVATAVSDVSGVYRFPSLPPGSYEVTAALAGFQGAKVQDIRLQLGQILKVDMALQIASVTETVQVSGESPIIDVKQNAASVTIQAELIERIPGSRDFLGAISSAPGAVEETRSGGFQIDGSSGSENRFVIDGLDTTSLVNGDTAKELLRDFVQEVHVKSSGYNAEYRAATGGVISAVTRTGSNSLRGSFGTYYSNDKWLGDIRPALRLNPSNQLIAEYTRTPRDPAYDMDFVMDLGGPVLRDRAWFYVGYGPQITRSNRTVTFRSNSQTQTFESDSDDHNLNYNVTSQLRDNLRVKFAGSLERGIGAQSLPGKEPDGTSTANPALFPNPLTSNTSNDSYVGTLDWVVTPKFFMSSSVGVLGYNTWQVSTAGFSDLTRRVFQASNFQFPEIPSNLQNVSGYADERVSTQNVRDKYGRFGVNVDATYYGTFAGRHTLKGGVQWEKLTNDVLTGAQAPTIDLFWGAARTTFDNRVVSGRYGYYNVSRFYTQGDIAANNIGLFIQDAWTISSRLTVNLGFRVDSEEIPSYRPENPGIEFGFLDKPTPRAGFAYDLKGDGKWKAYGSWGMFYDISKLEMPRGLWGAERWVNYYYTLDTFDWPSINCSYPPVSGPSCPGTFIEEVDSRHVANEPDNFLVDPNLKPIRTQEFIVGMDHELSHTMSIGVRYARKWLDRTIEDVGIQVPGLGEEFRIANPGFGIAEFTLAGQCPTCPAQPKAKREYDGIEIRLLRRLANNWSLNTSYVWSRIYGNYSGLASTDENGRQSPSVNRFFDGLYMSFDASGRPLFGRLQTDRPHQFKLQGTYQLRWGTGVGVDYFLASGTPEQTEHRVRSVPVWGYGRADLGRAPTFSFTDLLFFHDLAMKGTRLHLELNVSNLFDQETVTRLFRREHRDDIPVSDTDFFAGFDPESYVTAPGSRMRRDPRYTLADQYQGARSLRVMAKFRF